MEDFKRIFRALIEDQLRDRTLIKHQRMKQFKKGNFRLCKTQKIQIYEKKCLKYSSENNSLS